MTAFDAVTGPYELTLSRDVSAAAQRRTECTIFTAAEQTERSGDLPGAIAAYQQFRTAHPGSVLVPFVHTSLLRAFGTMAANRRSSGDPAGEIQVRRQLLAEAQTAPEQTQARADLAAAYVDQADTSTAGLATQTGADRVTTTRTAFDALLVVRREFGHQCPAAAVPQRMVTTFTTADGPFAAGHWCDSLAVLDYAVTLPAAETAGVVATATANRGKALYGCGLAEFQASHWDGALAQLNAFMAGYGKDPAAPQALALIIASKVGRNADTPMPIPAPVTNNSPGPNQVLYHNLTPYPLEMQVAGPTAHTFTLPACTGCPAEYPASAGGCSAADSAGKPTMSLRLPAGVYRDFAADPQDAGLADISGSVTVQNNYILDVCIRVQPPQ